MLRSSLLVLTAVLAAGCSHKEAGSDDYSADTSYASASTGDSGSGSIGSDTLAALKATSGDDGVETSSLGGGSAISSDSIGGGASSSVAVASAPVVTAPVASAPTHTAAVSAPMNAMNNTVSAPKAAASSGGDLGFGSQDLSVDLGAYARKVTNAPGEHVYPRTDTGIDIVQACTKFRGPDLAQTAFIKAGGPQKDPLGLDPDGDGYACGWDPTPFR